jgi:hypothetical protein
MMGHQNKKMVVHFALKNLQVDTVWKVKVFGGLVGGDATCEQLPPGGRS